MVSLPSLEGAVYTTGNMAPGLSETDLYELLGILADATESEIKTAYRRKALKCHPDKNPDNPRAAKEWEELSKALEILTDSEARDAYDKVLKAKKANELRNRALEGKRRKVKEDLEAREAAFRDEQDRGRSKDAAQQLQEVFLEYDSANRRITMECIRGLCTKQRQSASGEYWRFLVDLGVGGLKIKRLQEEGSQILAEEQRLLKEELKKGIHKTQEQDDPARLKIRWRSKKTDDTNGGYNYDVLYRTLQKYGAITSLLVSSKKKGSAVVEYESPRDAELAVKNEMGLSNNPLELLWLSGQPKESLGSTGSSSQQSSNSTETDFEFVVLQKLKRSAEQQKRSSQLEEGNAEQSTFQYGFHSNTCAADIKSSGNSNVHSKLLGDLSSRGDKNRESLSLDDSEHTEEKPEASSGHFVTSSVGAEAKDYESLVLMRMRQTAERQRLIEQMAREDAEEQ